MMLLILTAFLMCKATGQLDLPDLPFYYNYNVGWGDVRSINGGEEVQIVLDKGTSGGGIASNSTYLFGFVSMKIKLVPNDSAGTVTTFYMSSSSDPASDMHDELDFEFLGNRTGEPYIVQTNIFADGIGNREQQIYLWFDPTSDFHSYSILWNQDIVIFYVDDYPIRVLKTSGGSFLKSRPMKVYGTLWNGDAWATRGGLDKINWNSAPFIASYRGFNLDACQDAVQDCATSGGNWRQQDVDINKMKWVQDNYMIYNYCLDTKRFTSLPPECAD